MSDLYRDLPGTASAFTSGPAATPGQQPQAGSAPAGSALRLNSALAFAPTSLRRPPAPAAGVDSAAPPRRKRTHQEANADSENPQQSGWSLFGGSRGLATSVSVLSAGLAAPSGPPNAAAHAVNPSEGNLVGDNLYWDPPGHAGDSLVQEPYNPVKPNDFELHTAELEAQRVRAKQEMEALAELELQLQQQEEEGRRIQSMQLMTQSSASSSPPPGGGAGRGDSAPSLVYDSSRAPATGEEAYLRRMQMSQPVGGRPQQQQQQQHHQPPQQPAGSRLKHESPMPTRVVMLRNMVGRGEVDSELESETAVECEKHGRVLRCVVHEMPPCDSRGQAIPDSQAVRIFVEFAELPAAIAALRHLNGRFFAQREVIAIYWDEIALRNGKLG